jgi:hypothetical protein
MHIVFWTAGILFTLNALTSAMFFVLYLATGESVPRERALRFYRWAVLVALTTIDIVAFRSAYLTAKAIWWP